jgi:hypothetical protein
VATAAPARISTIASFPNHYFLKNSCRARRRLVTGPRELVHGGRESFVGRYKRRRSGPGLAARGRMSVVVWWCRFGEGDGAHDSHNRSPSASMP